MSVPSQKPSARHHFRELRRALPTAQRSEAESRIGDQLIRLVRGVRAQSVGVYSAVGSEVSLAGPVATLESENVTPVWPRVAGETRLAFVGCPLRRLVPGFRGILEPPAELAEWEPERLDLLLVPGLAFDPRGRRLGQGGGFYDRLLSRLDGAVLTVGVAFAVQVGDSVPVDRHDQAVACVVTEEGFFRGGVLHRKVEGLLGVLKVGSG